jgi:hypothetical protein
MGSNSFVGIREVAKTEDLIKGNNKMDTTQKIYMVAIIDRPKNGDPFIVLNPVAFLASSESNAIAQASSGIGKITPTMEFIVRPF